MVAINSKVLSAVTAAQASRAVDTLGGVQVSATINVTAVGATPTATISLQGSPSIGADAAWTDIAVTLSGAGTLTTNVLTVSAVGTTLLYATAVVKFLRLNLKTDTNVTLDGWITVGQYQPGAGIWIAE